MQCQARASIMKALIGNTKIFVLILLPLDFSVAIENEHAVPFKAISCHLLEQSAVVLSGCFPKHSGEGVHSTVTENSNRASTCRVSTAPCISL